MFILSEEQIVPTSNLHLYSIIYCNYSSYILLNEIFTHGKDLLHSLYCYHLYVVP
jgi:hypothetical protein